MALLPAALALLLPAGPAPPVLLALPPGGPVKVRWAGAEAELGEGGAIGPWTLMAILPAGDRPPLAVFEDFTRLEGSLLFLDPAGVRASFPKTAAATAADPATLYRGHTLQEVLASDRDLLGRELLAGDADPEYADVAACLPPIVRLRTHTFVGTPLAHEKIGFDYGGRTAGFDPAPHLPGIDRIRREGRVRHGLAGGWLPVVRFVYPETQDAWSEMLAFAALRLENGNDRVQPAWYRVARIESGRLRHARCFDSYQPCPPRGEAPAARFYADLLELRDGWSRALEGAMAVELPDPALADQARHCLVRAMMTRVGAYPKYGVVDRTYAGAEHDGFPDTFTAEAAAMLEWGLGEQAGAILENYFARFVRDDGSLLYRGPEFGQYGRMLAVAAACLECTNDRNLLPRIRPRLEGVAGLLLARRREALALPQGDPARGLVAGWSEADACLDPEPQRYHLPYLGNSAEAARGLRDLGRAWERLGREGGDPGLAARGREFEAEAEALAADLRRAIAASTLHDCAPPCLPALAGVREPFHTAARDRLDPQARSYRSWAEMLHSGLLSREQVGAILDYREAHRELVLGVPGAYGHGTRELAGFLAAGHAYGLLQHDYVREHLLLLHALRAHLCTRGSWTAPESRNVDPARTPAPYCVPAQLAVPLLLRRLLVFEDPATGTLWLAKGTPRAWLEEGGRIAVRGAPTRWGRLGFEISSHLAAGTIAVRLDLPDPPASGPVILRLRLPGGRRIAGVEVGGQPWVRFDAGRETVTLPPGAKGRVAMEVRCR